MKNLIIFSVVLAVAIAKPSGILEPHLHPLAYSAPIHETYAHGIPSVVHHHDALVHHPVHQTVIAEAPAVVHHKTFVSDLPTLAHQHSQVIHHGYAPKTIVAEAPGFVHHKSFVQPALHQAYFAEAPVVHHKTVVAETPIIHQQAIVADVPAAVSHQESTVVHKPAYQKIVEQVPVFQRSFVHEAPVVHHTVVEPRPTIVQHKSIVSEPIGVKQTISHQDSSIVHSAAGFTGYHHLPVVADAPVFVHHAAPISSQYHSQDAIGQYSFGYASPLSSKAEIKTADGITKGVYNYLDAFGKGQEVSYVSDDVHGFRVAATNLPVGPAPVKDTAEVASAKAAHFVAHESAKAAAAHVEKAADVSLELGNRYNFGAISAAPLLPSAYSYAYLAQQPLQHVVSSPIVVPDVPVVGLVPEYDTVAVDANIVSGPILQQRFSEFIPTLTAAGVPLDTPEVAQAKAAHFAAFRGVQAKDEKPCD